MGTAIRICSHLPFLVSRTQPVAPSLLPVFGQFAPLTLTTTTLSYLTNYVKNVLHDSAHTSLALAIFFLALLISLLLPSLNALFTSALLVTPFNPMFIFSHTRSSHTSKPNMLLRLAPKLSPIFFMLPFLPLILQLLLGPTRSAGFPNCKSNHPPSDIHGFIVLLGKTKHRFSSAFNNCFKSYKMPLLSQIQISTCPLPNAPPLPFLIWSSFLNLSSSVPFGNLPPLNNTLLLPIDYFSSNKAAFGNSTTTPAPLFQCVHPELFNQQHLILMTSF